MVPCYISIRSNEIESVTKEEVPPHIPIVAMTANAMKGDREICIEAGMDDYVAKPVSRKSIQDVIARVMTAI